MACSFLTITTNVGSIHSLPHLGPNWVWSIHKLISTLQPDVAAVHLQEAHDLGATDIHNLVQQLLTQSHRQGYVTHFVYFDEGSCGESTALGLVYLFGKNVSTVKIWNYTSSKFVPYESGISLSDMKDEYIEKQQFPSNLFPRGFPSRKGMIRSRWQLVDHVLEFVNLHLFHDVDNLLAIKEHPSIYARYRAAGLNWLLHRLGLHEDSDDMVFLFGDFNFRVNLSAYVKKFLQASSEVDTMMSTKQVVQSADIDSTQDTNLPVIEYYRLASSHGQKLALSLAHKLFAPVLDDQWFSALRQLVDFDEERQAFDGRLYELPITFPPSYPIETGEQRGTYKFASTRCPAWPDRVLMSRGAFSRLCSPPPSRPGGSDDVVESSTKIVYSSLEAGECTGDHTPVYLHFGLSTKPDRLFSDCH